MTSGKQVLVLIGSLSAEVTTIDTAALLSLKLQRCRSDVNLTKPKLYFSYVDTSFLSHGPEE